MTNDTSTSEDAPAAAADAAEATTTSRPSRRRRVRTSRPTTFEPAEPEGETGRRRPTRLTVEAPPALVDDGGDLQRCLQRLAHMQVTTQLRVEEGRAAAFIVNAHNEPVAELHAAVRKPLEAQLLLDALV